MSHFTFKAKKSSGEIYTGEKDAVDRYELYRILRESGEEIVEFKEKSSKGALHFELKIPGLTGRVKMMEKINFARNLGSMLEAGLPLSRALSVLERQTNNKVFKKVITDLIAEIDRGTTFSDSLGKHIKIFPAIFISMVHAGEQSGTLAESLKVVGAQMDSSYALERRVRGALIYPGVIISAMILIGILMFIFVVPVLLKTFTELKVELPFTTRMVLGLSNLIQNDGLILVVVIALVASGLTWWARRKSGKLVIHAALLKIPVIGMLVREVNTARTARTLSSLLSSGVDVVESVIITGTVVQNVHFRAVLEKSAESIKKGELMSKIFEANPKLYPVFFSEMISVGEETGKTGEMLLGVARYYEDDVDLKTKNMSTIIEPVLILIIGAAVGFFAVSMIQPMYSLVNAI
ncbi:MAG: type pilus assembly protein PilC [Candidatus Parcubacteria bacterium]|jgi:type IV pilus assembly protein PilC|nr:type pilus assembly protein PilC [Candidatus Parcubacteria bacterium]